MKTFLVVAIESEDDGDNADRVQLKLVKCEDCCCLLQGADAMRIPLYDAAGKDQSRVACPRCYNDWRREAFADLS